MYMRGAYQWNHWGVKKVWSNHPIFPAKMSLHRFEFLNRYIVLDDPETRVARGNYDRFAPVRELFECWNDNCGQVLQMAEYGCTDKCHYHSCQIF